jgi:WD40 repeat protein
MPTASGVSRTGLKPAMTRTQREATVSALQPAPKTAKGREIAGEMDQLADDFYGTDRAPTQLPRGVASQLSRSIPLITRIENQGWRSGPQNQEGRVFDASSRNLLCMDVQGPLAVVGSADHGLTVFNIETGRQVRTLFSKQFGHTEWVTSCAFLPDGRIVSGGMDSKLCLWQKGAARCTDLLGHTGSVSQVLVSDSGSMISSSYDRTLRIWDSSGRQLSVLSGHQNPVMQFVWNLDTVLSGDRKGVMKLWDLQRGETTLSFSTKGGQVGSLALSHDLDFPQVACVGDQSGTVTMIDIRSGDKIGQEILHLGGVVSSLKFTSSAGGNLLVSAGADKSIHCMDVRKGLKPIYSMKEHRDFIYSLETFGPLIISGAGNGWVLVHDSETGKCLYGLGANQAAVRCIFSSQNHLVVAGDDGKASVYDM